MRAAGSALVLPDEQTNELPLVVAHPADGEVHVDADTGTRSGEVGARRLLEKGFASPALIVETWVLGEAAHRGESPPQDDRTLLAFGSRE